MASYFAVFLVFLSFGSGLIWLIDAKVFAPKRRLALAEAEGKLGDDLDDETREKLMRQSAIAETAQSIFPVVLAITIFRSFVYEPFQIPSGSMKPTLLVGDFILVEKFSYGIKDPVTRTTLVETGKPQRGDSAVFKYPEDPLIDFIKRVVGLPGDRILYKDKTFYIKPSCDSNPENCNDFQKISTELISQGVFNNGEMPLDVLKEDLLGIKHELLHNPIFKGSRSDDYYKQNGTAINEWVVPPGHYFMVGDNRDNSRDSRFWGFVPEENFVGKAVFIWMSFEKHRDPDDWIPTWIPTDVRFGRLGKF
jgi:signal peptidase I